MSAVAPLSKITQLEEEKVFQLGSNSSPLRVVFDASTKYPGSLTVSLTEKRALAVMSAFNEANKDLKDLFTLYQSDPAYPAQYQLRLKILDDSPITVAGGGGGTPTPFVWSNVKQGMYLAAIVLPVWYTPFMDQKKNTQVPGGISFHVYAAQLLPHATPPANKVKEPKSNKRKFSTVFTFQE